VVVSGAGEYSIPRSRLGGAAAIGLSGSEGGGTVGRAGSTGAGTGAGVGIGAAAGTDAAATTLAVVSELRDAADGAAVGGADCTPKNVISATTASAQSPRQNHGNCKRVRVRLPKHPTAIATATKINPETQRAVATKIVQTDDEQLAAV